MLLSNLIFLLSTDHSHHGGEPHDRACLVRAIATLLEGASKEAFLADALKVIPLDKAACPANLASVLADRDLALVEPGGV